MTIKDYEYQSCLAPYIRALILQKRTEGYLYDTEEYHLKHFDVFCAGRNLTTPDINRDLVLEWGSIRNDECRATSSRRMTVVRQLAIYLQTYGVSAYIPTNFSHNSNYVAHVLPDNEINEFFKSLDNYRPKCNGEVFKRLSMEYRVLFRIIYCCGLRVSEARKLKVSDVDLENGTLCIFQSKGRNDRIVYLSQDLQQLCSEYRQLMESVYWISSDWFFPARDPNNVLSVSSIALKFRQFWAKTSYADSCDRSPSTHCLRHSFVVKRMNLWMEQGVELNAMMPYLSKYLGHSSPSDTFYYYHQIESAFKIIRSRDTLSSKIIPEVWTYED